MNSRNIRCLFFICALLGLFGCSKEPAPRAIPASAPTAGPAIRDLGTMLFSEDEPVIEDIGDGKTITLTATLLPDGMVQIKGVIEERDAAGKKRVLATPRAIAVPGHTVEMSINEVGLKFTPRFKGK